MSPAAALLLKMVYPKKPKTLPGVAEAGVGQTQALEPEETATPELSPLRRALAKAKAAYKSEQEQYAWLLEAGFAAEQRVQERGEEVIALEKAVNTVELLEGERNGH